MENYEKELKELEKRIAELIKRKKVLEEKLEEVREKKEKKEEERERKEKRKPAKEKIPVTVKFGGYEIEFMITLGRAPHIEGIPEKSDPEVDSLLWYLRTQSVMGQPLHSAVEETLDKLAEYVPESVIGWIREQFNLPVEQRETIPLTGESEEFINSLREELKDIIYEKFPDVPEEEVEKFVFNAIYNAISSYGWGDKAKIERSAKGYVRSVLRGA